MNKIRIGIDPGKQGYFAISIDRELVFEPMPIIGKEYDLQYMNNFLNTLVFETPIDIHCCLENVHAIQGAGATSNFQFGRGVGVLEAMLVAHRIPYTKVTPSKWQAVAWEGVQIQTKPNPKNKSGLSTDTKKTSLIAAKRLYPIVDLRKNSRCKVPHDGKVDALMILHYCMKKI